MRRGLLLLSTMTLMLGLTAGAALALGQIHCAYPSQNPLTPECFGTDQPEEITGQDVRDMIYARGGDDTAYAEAGDDGIRTHALRRAKMQSRKTHVLDLFFRIK